MPEHNLSRIDRKILRCLQHNARLSFAELARQVGLTTTPCKERVKRLERDGYICGYHADLNPEKTRSRINRIRTNHTATDCRRCLQ